jgi:lipoprotein-anchoring transpeptidase ErfK/SrfK
LRRLIMSLENNSNSGGVIVIHVTPWPFRINYHHHIHPSH